MNKENFQAFLESVKLLTPEQLANLEQHVRTLRDLHKGVSAIQNHTQQAIDSRTCPRCGAGNAYRHGRNNDGRQRFWCRSPAQGGCGRAFNGLTGTSFARMRKPEKWAPFIQALASGHSSINLLHKQGNIGVSRCTLWRWRKVVMQALATYQPESLQGIVEVDETFFRESFKGSRGWKNGKPPVDRPPRRRWRALTRGLSWEHVPVLTAIDRSGSKLEQVLGYRDDIKEALRGRIEKGSILCSDGLPTYRTVAEEASSTHFSFPPRSRRNKPNQGRYSLQDGVKTYLSLTRVNALHTGLKSFINYQAKGVSTKHLQGYLY